MELKKHISNSFISRVCFLASTLMINIFLSRLLGAANSGELYYNINNFSIISLVCSLSLESGMIYFLSKKEISDKDIAGFCFLWPIIVAGFSGILIIALFQNNILVANEYNAPIFTFVFILGTLATTYYSALFLAKQQFLLPLLVPAITNITLMILFGWLFFLLHKKNDHSTIISIYFLGFCANGLILGIIYHLKYSLSFLFRFPTLSTIKKLWDYSSLAFLTNIIAFLAFRIDYWILKGFGPKLVSEVDLGNYIQVAKLVQLFLIVPTVIATVVFPLSAGNNNQNDGKSFKKITLWVLLINMAACAIGILIGKWMFPFVFGKTFTSMYMCFVYSVPCILSMTIVRVSASYFAGINKVKYNFAGDLAALLIIIFFSVLLIPFMGINGAALADSAGYFVYMVFHLKLLRNKV